MCNWKTWQLLLVWCMWMVALSVYVHGAFFSPLTRGYPGAAVAYCLTGCLCLGVVVALSAILLPRMRRLLF